MESDFTHKVQKVKKAKAKIEELTEYLDKAERPDVDQMKTQKAELDEQITDKEAAQKTANKEISDLEAEEKLLNKRTTGMEGQGGTTCSKCEQPVPEEHVQNVLSAIQERKDEIAARRNALQGTVESLEKDVAALEDKIPNIKAAELIVKMNQSKAKDLEAAQADAQEEVELTELANAIKNKQNIVKTVAEKVAKNTPTMTMEEANGIISKKKSKEDEIARLWESIKQEETRTNPYEGIIEKARAEIAKTQSETKVLSATIKEFDEEIRHLEYIRKAYFERRRMKSFALAELIPYLNERIYYYLSAFGMDDFGLEFTNTLSVSTSQWDYELCSGGEQKRLDVSIQLGLYDLYTFMYGHQCNVMVLDEIDGRLDGPGIEAFKNIISNDFASRIGTILVISHKEEMIDAFPSKIMVRKENGFSYVVKNGF
jgi:DNA repair exonuclease SbcCD ATPase subunit